MHQALLILHFFFIAMGIGISFSNLVNLRVSKGQTGDIAKGLGMQRMAMRQIADGVVAGILITGGLLLWELGTVGLSGWFHLKMAFVAILVASYVTVRLTAGQMVRTGNMALFDRIRNFATVAWVAAVAALICAVLAFS
jgi:uncharacterized membrane protein